MPDPRGDKERAAMAANTEVSDSLMKTRRSSSLPGAGGPLRLGALVVVMAAGIVTLAPAAGAA
jgi:hypothetical protein